MRSHPDRVTRLQFGSGPSQIDSGSGSGIESGHQSSVTGGVDCLLVTERRRLRPVSLARMGRGSLGLAALAIVLAGCTQPTPLVTVQSHGVVAQSQADVYCRPTCTTFAKSHPTLTVLPGDLVGIDVAGPLAAAGWYVKINGQLATNKETSHYAAIGAPQLAPGGKAVLTVFKLAPGNRNAGVWQFILIGR